MTNAELLPPAMEEPFVSGSAEEPAASARDHAALGIAHVQAWLETAALVGDEAFRSVLELLDEASTTTSSRVSEG